MQNVMVLGANTLQIPLIQQVKKAGHRAIVVSPHKGEPGFRFADYPVYANVLDKEIVLKYAKKFNVSGVITDQTDIPVRTAAYVAEKMGLPGIGYETACLFTDKFLMRQKCKELGIPTLKYKKVYNVQEAIMFFETLNNEVILKPSDNQGSRGVTIATSKKELIDNFEKAMSYSNEGSVLVEQYVRGKEFVIEGLVHNYKFQNLICGEYSHFNLPGVFSSAKTIFPPIEQDNLIKQIEELNRKIITGFGLNNGRTHSEFIVEKNGQIYLVETAARGGGVFISSDVVPLTTGIDSEKVLIEIATNKLKESPVITKQNIYCCCLAFYLPVGEVISLDNIAEIKSLPFIHRNNLESLYIGMKTKPYTDKTGRLFMIISASSYEKLQDYIQNIKRKLTIKVQTSNGIKGPIWN